MSLRGLMIGDAWAQAAVGIGLAGSGLRALAVPPLVGDVDSVNFAHGLGAFDPVAQAPHFPGYPVYVLAARLLRELGVASDVWALALPSLILWPLAAVVLFAGARRWVGKEPAIGAVIVASLAPAAVVAGGWPASDGFGYGLLVLGVGALGLAAPVEPDAGGCRRTALLAGLLLGVTLGARLSYWPCVAALVAAAGWRWPALRRSVSLGTIAGVAVWLAPLALLVGVAPLIELGSGFVAGHFTDWGNTAAAGMPLLSRLVRMLWSVWDAGLGAWWPARVPQSGGSAGAGFGAALVTSMVIIGVWRLTRRRNEARWMLWATLGVMPYVLWVAVAQNVDKPRHLIVVLPVLGALLLAGSRGPSRLYAAGLAAALLVAAVPRAWAQGFDENPAVALTRAVTAGHAPGGLAVFAGEEARVIQHHAPMYRVIRPRDGEVLRREAERLARSGVEVWISSGTPGFGALAGELTLIDVFREPITLRGHDAELALYRYTLARQGVAQLGDSLS